MPRNYIRKKDPPKYTLEDVKRAVDDVVAKKKTYREASEYYSIPSSVIFHRIKGRKVPLNKMGGGVTQALPDRVERHLVDCLKTRARMGHPCSKDELLSLVGEYVSKLQIKTPFKDNKPGECWYQNFMKRHRSLSLKKAELLQKARVDARRPHVIYGFYDILLKEIKENNLEDKARYIFNADESGFHSDPSKLRGIGEKGAALSRVSGGSGRESTSVLACVAADGSFLPPLIVFKGTAVQARWVSDNAYPGTLYGATKNGWMEEATFYKWLVDGFIPYINNVREINNEPEQKVILIYDGHKSHISVRIVEDAINANIILIKFPSHLTDRIQPLDKCVFGPVKSYWEKTLVQHGIKQMGKGTGHLSKEKFAELLGDTWQNSLTSSNIISGFRSTGIFPVDASKFPKKWFNANELTVYQNLVHAINATIPVTTTVSEDINDTDLNINDIPNASSQLQANIDSNIADHSVPSQNTEVTVISETSQSTSSSSSLVNKILELLTLDTSTNDLLKTKILSAISSESNETVNNEIMSPNKNVLQNLFQIEQNNQQKKKVVIPRLKQATFGEVLTTDAVKERLKKAEEEKNKNKSKKRKNKGQGKRSQPSNINEETKTKQKKIKLDEEGSESEHEAVPYAESDDSDFNIENEGVNDFLEIVATDSYMKGNFVLVQFKGGKRLATTFRYLCMIDAVEEEGDVVVTSLKSVDSTKQVFSLNQEDTSSVLKTQIIGCLPEPNISMKGERIYYKFSKQVDIFEKL